jgi:hypothetical protein
MKTTGSSRCAGPSPHLPWTLRGVGPVRAWRVPNGKDAASISVWANVPCSCGRCGVRRWRARHVQRSLLQQVAPRCNMLQQRGVQHLARTRRRGACGASRQAAMHRPSATRLCTPGCGWVRRRAGTSDAGYLEAYGAGRGDHLVTFDDGRQVAWAPLCFFRRPFGGWVGSGSYAGAALRLP